MSSERPANTNPTPTVGLTPGEATHLPGLVSVAPGSIVSRLLARSSGGSVTLFAFSAGQQLSTHSAPYDAFLHVLSGRARVTVDGTASELSPGDGILMPANHPHAVHAPEDMTMQLVMLKG
ncbi:MAG: cupin domain-containing protein [Myxococcales bacterium]|nr:cupin domain-containing protein [Myxococcales bacterium]